MPPTRSAPRPPRRLLRVTVYYALLVVALVVVMRAVPEARNLLGSSWASHGGVADTVFGPGAAPAIGRQLAASPWGGALLGAVSMLGALVIMIPVTWIYLATRGERGFVESVVHTLLILPVAVAGIVLAIEDSVALAFSLAGIVAAVRFRTTLEDTKDAVYVFLAIGVGLASGAQALGLALVLSVVFNAVILVLWKTQFGNPWVSRGPGGVRLSEALAGLGGTPSAVVGDSALVDAAAPADLGAVLDRAARMERHVSEERVRKKKERANQLLLVFAREAGQAQRTVEPLLDELSARWKLAEITSSPRGYVLEYLTRIEAPGGEGVLLDRVMGAGDGTIEAAELRSLKGLKKRS